MKQLFRNFIYLIKRFKVSSLLNILGLAIAFTGFLLILIQLNYELGFDKMHSNADNIYRFRYQSTFQPKGGEEQTFISSLFIRNVLDNIVDQSPEIEKATLICPYVGEGHYGKTYFTVEDEKGKRGFSETLLPCYAAITEMFDFEVVEGNLDLSKPEMVIIPQSMAKRIFGISSAIGKSIHYNQFVQYKAKMEQDELNLVVGGVYKDFPANTQLGNYIYTAIEAGYAKDAGDRSNNFLFYAQLAKGADPKKLENIFSEKGDLFPKMYRENVKLVADKLTDIYYSDSGPATSYQSFNMGYKTGDHNTSLLLILISIFIIVIAAINFTNFSVALAPSRLKNITMQKVLGSTDARLRTNLIAEALITSIIAFIVASLLVYIIVSYNLLSFLNTAISQSSYLFVFAISFAIAILTGLVAGIRPAYYLTSFAPSEALKGKKVLSAAGFKARTVLVGFQFWVAIILISVVVLMNIQYSFMKAYKLGFDTDQVAIIKLNETILTTETEFGGKLKQHPAIIDVAYSAQKLGASDQYIEYGGMRLNGGESLGYNLFPVSWNFLDVMNIKLLEGRKYTQEDAESSETSLIINEIIHRETGASLGDSFTYPWNDKNIQRVVGIVDNIQFTSLRNESSRMAFTLNDKNGHHKLPFSYIKLAAGSDVSSVVAHIENICKEIDPTYPIKIEFYDEIYNELYKSENKLSNSITIFSLLAILIAIMGVFGLVMFEGEYRKREVALRKVMGSSVTQVLSLFNKSYVKILVVSYIFALPVVYYAINKWLEQFAYKAPLGWWSFLWGGIILLAIVLFTVSLQSYRAATNNPIDVLRSE